MMRVSQKLKTQRRSVAGQTLIIAIIILGVLLILGFAFASIISRSITEAGRASRRTVAGDLARAGVEYAHYQMLYGALGADWRPPATAMQVDGAGFTKDPDAMYLRPGSGLMVAPDPNRPTFLIPDRGGPDYMGAYSRTSFEKGRALIRVRWAPTTYNAMAAPTPGGLRAPGLARNYLVLEAVGRPGTPVDTNGKVDPTRQLAQAVQVALFPDGNTLRDGVGLLRGKDLQISDSNRLIAFASIGIIESSRYITNKHNVSRKAEIGFPTVLTGSTSWTDNTTAGVRYEGTPVAVPFFWGSNPTGAPSIPGSSNLWQNIPGGGSLWSNAGIIIHGNHNVVLNQSLGEMWASTGQVEAANQSSGLSFQNFRYNNGLDTWDRTLGALVGNQMSSSNPQFNTVNGAFRDGVQESDPNGYARRLAKKVPPSITTPDPQGGQNRYLVLSRQSGALNANGQNRGRFGYGRGVYVDSAERGNVASEDLREIEGAVKSLPNDWLNPNNATSQGWQGPYYVPLASYVQFYPDGFEIIRDSRGRSRFWRNPNNGGNLAQNSCRYYVRPTANGKTYIINTIDYDIIGGGAHPSTAMSDVAFANHPLAQEFNGVLYFEGDVRVRGVIPTDVQLSVVSMGSIYIDGSITKGMIHRDPLTGTPNVIPQRSKSMLMLMAQDYCVLNPTQFFAPAPGEVIRAKNSDNIPDTPNPFELDLAESPEITLMAQFLLNSEAALPATTWTTYAEQYTMPTGLPVSGRLNSNLLISSAADDNGPSYVGLDVITRTFADPAPTTTSYLFPTTIGFPTTPTATTLFFNAAGTLFAPASNIPVYGLGDPNINSYPKFETIAMPIFNATAGNWNTYTTAVRKLTAAAGNPEGNYQLSVEDPTLFRIRLNTVGTGAPKNFLAARTAIAPFDVKIEASMFAEEGSFFVIPGNWFNTNSDDTRIRFDNRVAALGGNVNAVDYGGGNPLAQAQLERFETFGNSPEVPFYGEPLDIRISIVGSVSENMPAPMSQQTEWLQKWGWIPRRLGGSGLVIPAQHNPNGVNFNVVGAVVPNLTITYDPVLATGSTTNTEMDPVRTDSSGWLLPPMPRLPVSPTLAYFGEENP